MALSTSSTVSASIRSVPTASRSNSLVSNASTNSGTSLKRRARTRTRALSNARRGKSTGPGEVSSAQDGEESGKSSSRLAEAPPLPPLNISEAAQMLVVPQVESPSVMEPVIHKEGTLSSSKQAELPIRSRVGGRQRALSSVHIRNKFEDTGRERQAKSENGSVRGAKTRARGLSVPRHVTFRSATGSSDSSSLPSPLTPNCPPSDSGVHISQADRDNIRDSLISNSTATSSSVYPRSTSTESAAESSLFPPSLKDRDEDLSSFSPRIVTQDDRDMEFNIDDVQYRLKLLVKNSYFLPPAHSKPSPISLAPPPPSSKPSSQGFLGLFGLGKSKSKPTTPVTCSPPSEPGPILRTTSDSTTAGGRVPRQHAHTAPQTPLATPFAHARINPTSSASRVVVLREKMDDLETAAKQAEKDMKTKVEGRKARSQTAPKTDYFDDVIDPTDAVDLPPPSQAYPFAVQASMMHGLGIQESLGAAVLAERLPPSSEMWSISSEDDMWRKALLHEAVSHSLHNTPDNSFMTASPPLPPEPMPSFRDEDLEKSLEDRPVSSTPRRQIGKCIVDPDQLSKEDESLQFSPGSSLYAIPLSAPTMGGLSPTLHSPWIATVDAPYRAETPGITHALAPPPRRFSSTSQPELPRTIFKDSDTSNATSDSLYLRKVASDPRLSAVHEQGVDNRPLLVMTPPPVLPTSSASTSALHTSNSDAMPSFSSRRPSRSVVSRYSDDELSYATPAGDMDDPPRPSMTISLHTDDNQLSLTDYSQPSPTVSAFQDAVFGSCRTPSPLFRRSHTSLSDAAPEATPRHAAMSPPPRVSSSLGPPPLPPPPRSPANKPVYLTRNPNPLIDSQSSGLPSSEQRNSSSTIPLAERRGHPTSILSLRIPTDAFSPAIHSAPAPASPTDFFDRIQSHPNAMDDLETSDESSESEDEEDSGVDDKYGEPIQQQPSVLIEARSRAISITSTPPVRTPIMRLGNHSTPQLTPSPGLERAFDLAFDPYKPISNIAPTDRSTFFASKKKGMQPAHFHLPIGGEPLYRRPSSKAGNAVAGPSKPRRPATADAASGEKARRWQRESLQRFDGMLLQHMAAERDTLKRITTNLSQNSYSPSRN
ncbi:unnamed protein product [Somion occarium]|uniref:Uncharacterized protein n=1 Tax=Somion occarium TaxID=3059160 RepID=A0ABP1EA88_9APHY